MRYHRGTPENNCRNGVNGRKEGGDITGGKDESNHRGTSEMVRMV